MIRKIWDIVSIVAIAHLLALAILIAVLAASGGFRGDRLKQARDALAGRPLPAAKVAESAKEPDLAALSTSGQLIAKEQANTQIAQLQVDQQMRELKNFKIQLDQARTDLEARTKQFDQDKKDWQARRDAETALLASEGFHKSLALYESMSPDQLKDLLMTMDDPQAVRIVSNMDERKAGKLAKAFAADAEKARLKKILDRLEKPVATQVAEPRSAGNIP